MKNEIKWLALGLFMVCQTQGNAQSNLNLGGSLYTENFDAYGATVQLELELVKNEDLSIPIRTSTGMFTGSAYTAFFIDEQIGFRRSFQNGFFFEEAFGAGLLVKNYKGDMWYFDEASSRSIPHGNKLVYSFMPCASFGIGSTFSENKNQMVWLRTKIYWDLTLRGLDMPYIGVELGYSITIKQKS